MRRYVITDPRPPRPWSNVITNERVGLASGNVISVPQRAGHHRVRVTFAWLS